MSRVGDAIGGWFRRCGALLANAIRAFWAAGMTAAGKSFLALIFTVAGAGVLTTMLTWALSYLMNNKQHEPVAYIAYGLLVTVAMCIFSFGKLLAGKQAFEAELWKFKFKASQSGDDDDTPVP
jgi:hypothetical protein